MLSLTPQNILLFCILPPPWHPFCDWFHLPWHPFCDGTSNRYPSSTSSKYLLQSNKVGGPILDSAPHVALEFNEGLAPEPASVSKLSTRAQEVNSTYLWSCAERLKFYELFALVLGFCFFLIMQSFIAQTSSGVDQQENQIIQASHRPDGSRPSWDRAFFPDTGLSIFELAIHAMPYTTIPLSCRNKQGTVKSFICRRLHFKLLWKTWEQALLSSPPPPAPAPFKRKSLDLREGTIAQWQGT